VIILDEPTNYLDRDGLGALVRGLNGYQGGVVIISHNEEFCNSVCEQKWIMEAGKLREEGEIHVDDDIGNDGGAGPDEMFDGAGNKIVVNKLKTMAAKDIKKAIKEVEKKLKDNKKKPTLSEEQMWELDDKLAELKQQLEAAI
jgi:elongation factor 3